MHALRIIAACAVNGMHLDPGTVLAVPDQIAANDAETLVRMRRAILTNATSAGGAAKPAAPAVKPARAARHAQGNSA